MMENKINKTNLLNGCAMAATSNGFSQRNGSAHNLNSQNSNVSSKSSLRRNTSYGDMIASEQMETKVLVIYTGGTIGMMRNDKNGMFKITYNYLILICVFDTMSKQFKS